MFGVPILFLVTSCRVYWRQSFAIYNVVQYLDIFRQELSCILIDYKFEVFFHFCRGRKYCYLFTRSVGCSCTCFLIINALFCYIEYKKQIILPLYTV